MCRSRKSHTSHTNKHRICWLLSLTTKGTVHFPPYPVYETLPVYIEWRGGPLHRLHGLEGWSNHLQTLTGQSKQRAPSKLNTKADICQKHHGPDTKTHALHTNYTTTLLANAVVYFPIAMFSNHEYSWTELNTGMKIWYNRDRKITSSFLFIFLFFIYTQFLHAN